MANQIQLQRQIQEEIDREAKIEKRINNFLKRFLKDYKQYKLVNDAEKSDCVVIFSKLDPTKFNMVLTNGKKYCLCSLQPDKVLFYLKNKNKHNSKC